MVTRGNAIPRLMRANVRLNSRRDHPPTDYYDETGEENATGNDLFDCCFEERVNSPSISFLPFFFLSSFSNVAHDFHITAAVSSSL